MTRPAAPAEGEKLRRHAARNRRVDLAPAGRHACPRRRLRDSCRRFRPALSDDRDLAALLYCRQDGSAGTGPDVERMQVGIGDDHHRHATGWPAHTDLHWRALWHRRCGWSWRRRCGGKRPGVDGDVELLGVVAIVGLGERAAGVQRLPTSIPVPAVGWPRPWTVTVVVPPAGSCPPRQRIAALMPVSWTTSQARLAPAII